MIGLLSLVSSNVARTKRQFGRKWGTQEAGYTGRGGCGVLGGVGGSKRTVGEGVEAKTKIAR